MACFVALASACALLHAQDSSKAGNTDTATPVHATHVLGFEGVAKSFRGDLRIEGGVLQFWKDGNTPAADVSIASIEDVVVGAEDKQVGGVPMTLGKAAVPYGGGRVVSLISHKRFDTVTLEYLDAHGGFHGAIFEVNKGEGQTLRNELIRAGAHVSGTDASAPKPSSPGAAK